MSNEVCSKGSKCVWDVVVSTKRSVLDVPVNTIAPTPYNPKDRVDLAGLQPLIKSLKEYGLMYPLLITEDRQLVDGNRRWTALRVLGVETVECLMTPLTVSSEQAFTAVNSSAIKINSKGWLSIGLNGGYLAPSMRKKYDELQATVGEQGIDLLVQAGLGLSVLSFSKRLINSFGVRLSLEVIILRIAMKAKAGRKEGIVNRLNMTIRRKDLTLEEIREECESILAL